MLDETVPITRCFCSSQVIQLEVCDFLWPDALFRTMKLSDSGHFFVVVV